MPVQPEITEQEITLSIIKLEGDMITSLHKASKFDRVGRWQDAEDYMQQALASLLRIGVLESNCEGVVKEAECGIDDLIQGEFIPEEIVAQEFTKQTFKGICQ